MNQHLIIAYSSVFVFSLVAALVITWLVRKIALRYQIGEAPDPRKVHKTFMPHMGGFGIFAGFIIGILLSIIFLPDFSQELIGQYGGLIVASFLIVALGAYDDLKGLNAGRKFLGQFIIVSVLIFSGCQIKSIHIPFLYPVSLGYFSIPVTYLWLIGVSNAVNLLDGLDGLAAGFSAIASVIISIIAIRYQNFALLIISLSLLAGLLGFLRFNYHPAKIFMGDTGSLFLGLILAAISVKVFEDNAGQVNLVLPMIILAIPIGDTAIAFFRRLNKGRHPFKPDKDHLHHRLIYLGLSHKQAVHTIYLVAIIYAITAYEIIVQPQFISVIILFAVFAISFFGLTRVGYLESRRKKNYYDEQTTIRVKQELAPLSLNRLFHKLLFFLVDVLATYLALFLTWYIKYKSGLLAVEAYEPFSTYWYTPIPIIFTFYWFLLFLANNLYSLRWDVSRFDHLMAVSKTILFGGFMLMLVMLITIEPGNLFYSGRLILFIYILCVLCCIAAGRILLIQIEKHFKILEYGLHNTLLVGTSEKGRKLLKDISSNPHLLYNFVGYVEKDISDKKFYGLDCIGTFNEIPKIVRENGVEEIVIAINERSRSEILNIVAGAENTAVVFKILPQLYDVISGHKTAEITGHPLIRLFPDTMHFWQWTSKRIFDILLSFVLIIILLPLFLITIIMQIITGIHPVFVIQNMVGKFGVRYGLLNLNTEVNGKRNFLGDILYRSRFYKFPALMNIFLGQMSFIGPRPEDEETAEQMQNKVKFYNRRFQIRPGLTGWAQVRFRYEEALKYKREQIKHDLYYLENMSLTFDLRIFLRSIVIFFVGMKKK